MKTTDAQLRYILSNALTFLYAWRAEHPDETAKTTHLDFGIDAVVRDMEIVRNDLTNR